jgi:hypothetical protein
MALTCINTAMPARDHLHRCTPSGSSKKPSHGCANFRPVAEGIAKRLRANPSLRLIRINSLY